MLGFDFEFTFRNMLADILGRNVLLDAFADSKTVFDVIAKNGNTTERRLQIYICSLKESYANGELSKIGWMPGGINAADEFTKETLKICTQLWLLKKTNNIEINPVGWASITCERKEKIVSVKHDDPLVI